MKMKRTSLKENSHRCWMTPDYSRVRVGDTINEQASPFGKIFGEVKVIEINQLRNEEKT